MLRQRIITALLLAPIVISAIYWGNAPIFALLVAILQLASSFEWLKLNRIKSSLALIISLTLTGLTYYLVIYQPFVLLLKIWMLVYVLIWLVVLWWLKNHKIGYQRTLLQSLIKSIFGVLAVVIFALSLNHIHQLPQGNFWTLVIFFLIWIADIGAYFSGKNFGKNKLSVEISPGKTKEGVYGALVAVLLYAVIISQLMPIELIYAVIYFPLIALFSVVGDLAASLGKRQSGVKDSSNLLPGHGGFIDRFDSLIAASPLFSMMLYFVL